MSNQWRMDCKNKYMTEPTLQEMARYIVEINGGCWHEWRHKFEDKYICKVCNREGWADTVRKGNPTFTDDAGKVELLRLMMGREDWNKFNDAKLPRLTQPFIEEYITDTTGKLLRAAYEFLKENEK